MTKFNEMVWYRMAYPLARWLARLGLMKSVGAWQLLYHISPGLAGLVVFMDAASRPANTFIWWWPEPSEEGNELDDLFTDVSELIERAPAPGGLDTYRIAVDRLSSLAGDQNGVDADKVEATLNQRKAQELRCCKGNRYYDWKKGQGKAAARELLAWACPTAKLPVTVVRITVNGDVAANAVRRWRKDRVG